MRGRVSSVRTKTSPQASAGAPVEKILRPVTDQPPSAVRRATVAGRPPRAGVPSSGSTRSALTSAPQRAAPRPSIARAGSGQAVARRLAARWVSCMANTSAVEAQASATRPTSCADAASPASAPPSSRRAVSASRPCACSRSRLPNGKLPSRSCAGAASAMAASASSSGSASSRRSGACIPSITDSSGAAWAGFGGVGWAWQLRAGAWCASAMGRAAAVRGAALAPTAAQVAGHVLCAHAHDIGQSGHRSERVMFTEVLRAHGLCFQAAARGEQVISCRGADAVSA